MTFFKKHLILAGLFGFFRYAVGRGDRYDEKETIRAPPCRSDTSSLAGCGSREPLPDITDNQSSASASSDITSADESSGDIPASPSVPAESESPAESVSETRQQTEVTKSPAKPTGTEDAAEPKQPARAEEKTNPVSSAPRPEEPEPQKPTSAPTQPPAEEPPQSEPPQESTPPEEPAVPDFNIQTWIDYAKTYAVSVGLRLESSAVDCWDNPITAGPHSLYLNGISKAA